MSEKEFFYLVPQGYGKETCRQKDKHFREKECRKCDEPCHCREIGIGRAIWVVAAPGLTLLVIGASFFIWPWLPLILLVVACVAGGLRAALEGPDPGD